MELQQRIDADIKKAMLARDKDSLNALRAIKSAMLLELTKGGQQTMLDDAAGVKILQKLLKQRQESAAIYMAQGRPELAQEEVVQADVISAYLPPKPSDGEVARVVASSVSEVGATSMADMGKVIAKANEQLNGTVDGATLAMLVKAALNGG